VVRRGGDALADVLVDDRGQLSGVALLSLDEKAGPEHGALDALVVRHAQDALGRRRRAVAEATAAGEAVEEDDPLARSGAGHAGELRDVLVDEGVLEDAGQAGAFPETVVCSPRYLVPLARLLAPLS
jgi:hypothetical protein